MKKGSKVSAEAKTNMRMSWLDPERILNVRKGVAKHKYAKKLPRAVGKFARSPTTHGGLDEDFDE